MRNSWFEQIREWGENPAPENSRNLIRAFRQCESGEIRLEVLNILGGFSDRRSHGFLADLARSGQDLAERECAIRSIGRRGGSLSRNFLFHFLGGVPNSLQACVFSALGQARVFRAVPYLLSRLDSAVQDQDRPLIKAIAVALGELKGVNALAPMRSLLDLDWVRGDRELALPVLFALGRLERRPELLAPYVRFFREDPFANQVFDNALNQAQLRSQVRIEDYLHRVFHATDPHPSLPLELRAFDPQDLAAGLSVFDRVGHWRRHLFCLRALAPPEQLGFFKGLVIPEPDRDDFLAALRELDEVQDPGAVLVHLDSAMPEWCSSPERRLARIEAFPQATDWIAESIHFSGLDEKWGITLLNHWSDWNSVLSDVEKERILNHWVAQVRTPGTRSRLCRSAADAGVRVSALDRVMHDWFKVPSIRDSVLLYAGRVGSADLLDPVMTLPPEARSEWSPGALRYLEALSSRDPDSRMVRTLKYVLGHPQDGLPFDSRISGLRILQRHPLQEWEAWVVSCLEDPDPQVELSAVMALRSYPDSEDAANRLSGLLDSPFPPVRDRALDGLCLSRVPLARARVLGHLQQHAGDDSVVDRVFRQLQPGTGDDQETARILREILSMDRSSPQAVKMEEMLARFSQSSMEVLETSPELDQIDARLRKEIPRFDGLEPTIRLALRAAEQPFLQAGIRERLPIDKAPTVLQYCKSLDLVLDRYLGQKLLFPRIDEALPEFQQIWHRLGFVEEYPLADRVIYLTGLKGRITPEHFPLHKAKMMCGTFFNGRIMQDRYKVFDGLRAWAVIFLLFARRIPGKDGGVGPVVGLPGATDVDCVEVAVKLMSLQDLRNPAAHRQTYPDLDSVREVREDSLALVNRILGWVL